MQNQIEQKEEDIKRLQSELNESEDSSADVNDFAAWLTGYDGGGSEISQNADSNPLKHIAKELTPKYDPDQD